MFIFKDFKKKIMVFTALLFLAGVSLFFQSTKGVQAALNGEGLTISPPVTEITLNPGEKTTKIIRVTNPTGNLVEVYPRVMDFRAKGEGGEPAFYESSDETAKYSLSKWVTFNQPKIALTPEQIIEFKYDINVPTTAEPGGHYGVLFFATDPPKSNDNENKVSLGSMIGSLVLVKVPGAITEKGLLENFSADKYFNFDNDITFITKIANLGNIHFKPRGEIVIKNALGGEVDKIIFNEQSGNVLPDSTRKFENKWKSGKKLVGLYQANLHIVYGDSEKTLDKSISFIVTPWWVDVPVGIAFIIIITLVTRFIIRRRKKKRQGPKSSTSGSDQGGKVILR